MRPLKLAVFLAATLTMGICAKADPVPRDQIKQEFEPFIAKFRAALKANDPAAVAALTNFPFFHYRPRDVDGFKRDVYGKLFPGKVRACLARAKADYERDPDENQSVTMTCGDTLFVFSRTPNGFRFVKYGAED